MKQSITVLVAVALFLGAAAPICAESLSCTAGDYFLIQGELQNEIFTAQAVVVLAGANIVDVQNLKYKKSAKPGSYFLLVEEDASQKFVPGMLDLTIGTPSLVYFSLPSKDDKGQLRPVRVRALMTCEKAASGPKAAPQYSLY